MRHLSLLTVLFLWGCAGYPAQAYYHGKHAAPNQVGYVSTPYYSHARTKGYVSSYPSEALETPTYAPYPQFYVSANAAQTQMRTPFGVGFGLVRQRVEGPAEYYVLQHPQMHMALQQALDQAPAAQTIQVGVTPEGAPILFTANNNVYQAARTGEWCREGFLEAATQGIIRGVFCKSQQFQQQSPQQSVWALVR